MSEKTYPCCPEDDEKPCPQAETGHDLPCNGPACTTDPRVIAARKIGFLR